MSSRVFLAPVINGQHFVNGVPAEGYKLKVFQPDTELAAPIYNGVGLTTLAQPILINAWGFPASPIFLVRDVFHDLVLTDQNDVVIQTWPDAAVGGDGTAATPTEWAGGTYAIGPLSKLNQALEVTSAADIRAVVPLGRRVRVFGTIYTYGHVERVDRSGSGNILTITLDTTMTTEEFTALTSLELSLLSPRENEMPGRKHEILTTVFAGDVSILKTAGLNIWPVGAMVQMSGSAVEFGTVPDVGYLQANGQAVSRTTYATLFAAIGTTFGVGDGSTTFNVPTRADENGMAWWIFAQA